MSPVPPFTPGFDAALVGITDAGNNFTATNVEGALAELAGGGGPNAGALLEVAETIFQTAVSSSSYADVFDMEIALTGDGVNRVWLEWSAGVIAVGAASPLTLQLWDDTDSVALHHAYHTNPGASQKSEPSSMRALLPAFSGTKTFKVRAKRDGANAATINGDGDQPRVMILSAIQAEG